MHKLPAILFLAAFLLLPAAGIAGSPKGLAKIENIVVIYLENHSFDSLYGLFPGADGLAAARPEKTRQVDLEGKVYRTLPPVMNMLKAPPERDERFPPKLPNKPFEIDRYVPIDQKTGDLTHRFYQHQQQINGGRMDRFAAVSEAGGLVMGHYDGRQLPLWRYAKRYTLADHFFQAAFGGSFLNHQWLACACTPRFDHAPKDLITVLDDQGELIHDGAVTPDGYAVNTLYPAQAPHPEADPATLLPPQTFPTLGDRLSDKKVSWAWYAGGWNDAVAGKPNPHFEIHHLPYVYFKRYAEGTKDRAEHLKDGTDFLQAIEQGTLPAVSFYKPLGNLDQHPGSTDVLSGDRHVAEILGKIERSPQWLHTLVIVTYDEFGGFWDHVPPPKGDRWGPGSRIPALIVSPYAKRGHVDHTPYDTTAVLKLIETRFGLEPLGERDAKAGDLSLALNLK